MKSTREVTKKATKRKPRAKPKQRKKITPAHALNILIVELEGSLEKLKAFQRHIDYDKFSGDGPDEHSDSGEDLHTSDLGGNW